MGVRFERGYLEDVGCFVIFFLELEFFRVEGISVYLVFGSCLIDVC